MIPAITWYQNKDKIFITLAVSARINLQNYQLTVDNNILSFEADNYKVKEQLFNNAKILNHNENGRNINIVLTKESDEEWDYLVLDKTFNKSHVKINWNNWKDYDSNESNDDNNEQAFDMEQFSQMAQGMGGMEGMEGVSGMEGLSGMEDLMTSIPIELNDDNECDNNECDNNECDNNECDDNECDDNEYDDNESGNKKPCYTKREECWDSS